ncbi:MAG: glycosyltransferase [Acidobacteriia bacterium]|nr:glycosyltransferase [Terriglobia bacterium]
MIAGPIDVRPGGAVDTARGKASPEVTVLTAVHNGQGQIGETVANIQAQTFGDWEYIIVDDASEDGTAAAVEEAMLQDPRIRLVRRAASGGPYVAANDGLRIARGTFVVRIDADDLSPVDRIQKQRDFLLANPRYRACVSFYEIWNEDGPMAGSTTELPLSNAVFCWYLLLRCPSIHSSVCYLRSAMAELGGYRELALSQDYRLWCELTRRQWLGVMPEVLSYVRTHKDRASFSGRPRQRELALDVVADHLLALTGEVWPRAELEALRAVGHSERMPVRKGLEVLDRWDRLWRAAPGLSGSDRRELARLSAMRRRKHLRANARSEPVRVGADTVRLAITRPTAIFGRRPEIQSPVVFQDLEDELQPMLKYLRGNVLNAGCGERDITRFLMEHGAESVENCDAKTSIPNAICCDLGNVPRPANTYDSILCNAVMEHVRDVDAVMRELRRLVKPGGHLVVSIPFLQPHHGLDFRRYTREGMLELARAYELELVVILPVNSIAQTVTWIVWAYLEEKRKRVLQLLLWLPLWMWCLSSQRTDFRLQTQANGFQMVLRKQEGCEASALV